MLYVDDDPSALELVERLLGSTHRRVVATPEPEEGLSWVRTLQPHLVLLDVQMPRISGWNVLAQLRAEPSLEGLRIVVLTAEGEEPVARALGADRLLRKPIERQRLLEVVDGLLGPAGPREPAEFSRSPDGAGEFSRSPDGADEFSRSPDGAGEFSRSPDGADE